MKLIGKVMLCIVAALLSITVVKADAIVLPMDLVQIGEESFNLTPQIDTVILGENVQRIESRAFAGSGVKRVIFSGNSAIEYIAPDAFDGTSGVQFVLGNGAVEKNYVGTSGVSAAAVIPVTRVSTYADKNTSGNDSMYGHVAVYFDTYAGAQNYRVYYRTEGQSAWFVAGDASESPANIEMAPNENYQFSVCALDADGNRISSLAEHGYDFLFLEAPVITSVVRKSSTSVTVSWDPVPGTERYRVYFAKKGAEDWTRIKIYEADGTTKKDLTSDVTSFTITGLTENAEYHFSVRCTAADGRALSNRGDYTVLNLSQPSSVMKITKVAAKADPSIEHNDTMYGHVDAYWDEYKGASSYRVYCKEESEASWSIITEVTASPAEFELTPGENYQFAVCALDAEGNNISSLNPNGYRFTYLEAPSISNIVKNSSTSVTISWDPVPGTECYRVYFAKVGDTDWTRIRIYEADGKTKKDLPSTQTSFTITELEENAEYHFSTRCTKADGTCISNRGDLKAFRISDADDAFQITKVSARADTSAAHNDTMYGHVFVEWPAVNGAEKYAVYYREESQTHWTLSEETSVLSADIELTPGNSYRFLVRALDVNGAVIENTDQNGYAFTFLEAPVITSITSKKVDSTHISVTINWSAVPGTECYRVYYAKATADGWTRIKIYEADGVTKKDLKSSVTSFTIENLTPNTEYHFSVRCTKTDGTCLSNRGDMKVFTTPRTWTKTYDSALVQKVIDAAKAAKKDKPTGWWYINSKGNKVTLCAGFVVDMCNKAKMNVASHDANVLLSIAQKAGTLHTDKNPPKGAFVYWLWKNPNSEGKNFGHVALSLGNGQIIHAWSDIKITPMSDVNNSKNHGGYIYMGWSEPEGYVFK